MDRRFRPLLLLCLLLGLAAQGAILAQSWSANPLARQPYNDALVYWDWAAAIARGELVGDTPFLSAPLYPYWLGVLRALGAGLPAVFALQALLHVATAALLGATARRHFGAGVGLAVAASWTFLLEPAFSAGRVLNSSLQLVLTAWTIERFSALVLVREGRDASSPAKPNGTSEPKEGAGARTEAWLGLALGLTTLAHPPLLVALPLVALAARLLRGATHATLARVLAPAALAIAPATLHNRLASGEWIPISAQAGVTFSHGNNPGATGVYSPVEGVSASRAQQNLDALDRARAELGANAGWKECDRFFFDEGLAWWRAEPLAALRVMVRKAWYFLSGCHYGDIYLPRTERATGLSPWLWLTPLASAWFVLPGLVGLVWLTLRAPRRFGAWLVLAAIPLAVVVVFWYSPRYRLPALPPLVIGAVWLGSRVLDRDLARGARALAGGAFVLALAFGPLNAALGFDTADEGEALFEFQLGSMYSREENHAEAERHLRRALELGHPQAAITLGDVVRRRSGPAAAIEALRAALRAAPDDPYALRSLATALAEAARVSGDAAQLEEARALFAATVERDPNDWRAVMGLGNVLLGQADTEGALAQYARAAELAPTAVEVHVNRGSALAFEGRTDEARASFERALELEPANVAARMMLVSTLVAGGRHGAAIATLREGLAVTPGDAQMIQAIAFHLASAPLAADRDGEEAERWMRDFDVTDPMARAVGADTRAMARAERGDFDGACALAREAIAGFEAVGADDWASEARGRLQLYERDEAWRQAR